jgi:hypothetical protein
VRRPDGSGERVLLALTDAGGGNEVSGTSLRLTAESLVELAALTENLLAKETG